MKNKYQEALKKIAEIYGKTWFATLAQAKRKLREKYPNCKFEKVLSNAWEVRIND